MINNDVLRSIRYMLDFSDAKVVEIVHLAEVFRARIVDLAPDSLTIEITGGEDKIDGLVDVLRPYGVVEMARTGRLAMTRSPRTITAPTGTSSAANAAWACSRARRMKRSCMAVLQVAGCRCGWPSQVALCILHFAFCIRRFAWPFNAKCKMQSAKCKMRRR